MTFALNAKRYELLASLLVRHNRFSRRLATALLALLATSTGAIHAQSRIGAAAAAATTAEVPWLPDVIAVADTYLFDSAFNQGHYIVDHFAGPIAADEAGVFTAQMSNGDSVVAGLVPSFGALGTCNNGTDLCRLGLVRYNAQGVRVPWSNPGAYGFNADEYVIYPATNTTAKYQFIRDLKVGTNDQIYVMVDTGLPLLAGTKNVEIESFGSDGGFIQSLGVFGLGGGGDTTDFYGAQIGYINNQYVWVMATGYPTQGGPYIAANRLKIEVNKLLSQDPAWGSFYSGQSGNRLVMYRAPGGYCGNVNCEVTASYAMASENSNGGYMYIGGSVYIAGSNWDPIVLKINYSNGQADTTFNGTGWSRVAFDEPASSLNDLIAGLYVYHNEVYLAAQVARKCFQGIGLAKLNGANGQNQTAFGSGGKIVFGGQGNDPICYAYGHQKAVPYAIAATLGRIGVVGYQGSKSIVTNDYLIDPMLAVVNAVNGSVISFDSYPLRRTDGSRSGDAIMADIYGGALSTSAFTVSGFGRDTNAGNTLSYVTGRFISSDRIFGSGFGAGSDQ